MATEAEKIVIECRAGIGLVGCRQGFTLTYMPEDFEGMSREQIEEAVNKDAYEYFSQTFLDLVFELPEGLGEEATNGDK